MAHQVVAPSVGESITEVSILKWHKQNGESVEVGDILLEIESDKATVEIVAEEAGILRTLKEEGDTVQIGEQIAEITEDHADSITDVPTGTGTIVSDEPEDLTAPKIIPAQPPGAPGLFKKSEPTSSISRRTGIDSAETHLSPAVRKAVVENDLDPSEVTGTGKDGRLTKGDVIDHMEGTGHPAPGVETTMTSIEAPNREPEPAPAATAHSPATTANSAPSSSSTARPGSSDRPERRVRMSRIRTKIAERLVEAQQTAAILTTFNEVDMGPIMNLRKEYKEAFKAKHGYNLGFMSFFTKACVFALKEIEGVNAYIEDGEIIYHDFCDIGIAVGTDRGLVVPVLRNAERMTIPQIEKGILDMALKARDGKLSIADMSGGTFTISNGGVYGSMLSTPILNPPQSGILGMHNIIERPMVVEGQVVARPMMYLALSYDHRIVDGKEAVTFLIRVKEHLEEPQKLGLEFLNEL